MIVRLVRMGFHEDGAKKFQEIFSSYSDQIAQAEGCSFLELWRDSNESNVFFTHSHWNDESDLEKYRKSELFKEVWGQVKPLFDQKPQAWTVHSIFKSKMEGE